MTTEPTRESLAQAFVEWCDRYTSWKMSAEQAADAILTRFLRPMEEEIERLRPLGERYEESRGMIRDLTTVLKKRNREVARLTEENSTLRRAVNLADEQEHYLRETARADESLHARVAALEGALDGLLVDDIGPDWRSDPDVDLNVAERNAIRVMLAAPPPPARVEPQP